jgi:hypothetical protein
LWCINLCSVCLPRPVTGQDLLLCPYKSRITVSTAFLSVVLFWSTISAHITSVRATLQSEQNTWYLQGKTKELISRLKTRKELLPCKGKPKRIL